MPKNGSNIDLTQDNRNSAYISPKKIDNFNKNISYVKKSRNMVNSNSDRYKIKINDNYNSLNNKDNYTRLNNRTSNLKHSNQSMGSLPSIRLKKQVNIKNINPLGLISHKKNYDNLKNDVLKKFFEPDDLDIINKIFANNANGLEAFKLKLCIIHKSKESLNSKYNLEIKKYNERIISAQEQIEYLNTKIRESEVNYRVLQTQMNEFVITCKHAVPIRSSVTQKKDENLQATANVSYLCRDEDNNLLENINNFVRIQKMMNPDNVNEEFCSKIISYYEAKRSDNYEIIKINN
jgi:hypothetical protein